ncbi:MAG: c-type cytochrome [Burkholderiales bacterium]|nr:c-type cytochrome [Burkholderiales bacterium]
MHTRSLLVVAVATLSLCVFPANAAGSAADLSERLAACTACHGKEGRTINAEYLPRIAGKPAGYLYNQLLNFRDGRRNNAAMSHLLQPLSDTYLREIAAYFSALDLPYPPPAASKLGADELRHGEALVLRGDAARKLPACSQCHGTPLTGVTPAIPGLLGLPAAYMGAQLGAWRAGQRKAHAPDCMSEMAKSLTQADINAVAGWLAAQPMPSNSKPLAALPAPLPLNCGGVPQ